jgi:AraC family transcriptional regulator, melibiose operon regulatory protein
MGLASWRGQPPVMERFHRHNEVELNYVEEGSVTYVSGASQATVSTGQFAVFWAAIPHRLVRREEPTTLHWLTLPLAWFLRWRLSEPLVHAVLHGKVVSSADTGSTYDLALFRRWHDDLEDGSEDRREVLLLELEARLRRLTVPVDAGEATLDVARPLPDERGLDNVERMTRYIAEHYAEPLRVADIARVVGLHPNYALTLFRRVLGMGIVDYVTQHRVTHAQRLLATTDSGVLEIAFASGFGSASRFYVAFKSECGLSPGAYRASVRSRYRASL